MANESDQQQQVDELEAVAAATSNGAQSDPIVDVKIAEKNDTNLADATKTVNLIDDSSSTTTTTNAPISKPNGLKNRIIQRPPPLILDKVSNFYDNQEGATNHTVTKVNTLPAIQNNNNQHNDYQHTTTNNQQQQLTSFSAKQNLSKQQDQQVAAKNAAINSTTSEISSNHKFWASLNRNVSRARANANQQHRQSVNSLDNAQIGPDLIITRRESSGNGGRAETTCILQSPMATQQNHNLSSTPQKRHTPSSQQSTAITSSQSGDILEASNLPDIPHFNTSQQSADEQDRETTTPGSMTKPHDMSNLSSELGDEAGATSENGTSGGNLIGIDNPPTPTMMSPNNDDPPASATSSRPRSNNPFLVVDDDEFISSSPVTSTFHKRPASFIAATEKGQRVLQSIETNIYASRQANEQQAESANNHQQQDIQTRLNEFHIKNSKPLNVNGFPHDTGDSEAHYERDSVYIRPNPQHHQQDHKEDNNMSSYKDDAILSQQQQSHRLHNQQLNYPFQQQHQQQSVYDIRTTNSNYINHTEPTISIDSESAVCKPPPSATMQLPYWTDAIYELNNAILETRSVAGGAENGQFIHIAESGDIILELDRVKVSGYTLEEFNVLLESRSMHLLNAVQTKHSYGISIDLKCFLSQSFPKESPERELQNLIRENVYRRTIPCTTRPPKDGEVDRADYYFLTKDQFIELNNRGILLECGTFGGHYYGTMRPMVDIENFLSHSTGQSQNGMPNDMLQPLIASHPVLRSMPSNQTDTVTHMMGSSIRHNENPLYENNESLKMHHGLNPGQLIEYTNDMTYPNRPLPQIVNNQVLTDDARQLPIMDADSEPLPMGWEKVTDQTHGTYYIDHNTKRTQYERPYEVELTKGVMGFGFTLVETDDGLLLVRGVIPGGPAYASQLIRPGDILVSAVGVTVSGLAHTDVARLFSTFAVGDRIRLTFARSSYIVDSNLVPDEYLISNGTNGDLAVAIHPNHYNQMNPATIEQSPYLSMNQEFELISVTLKRGDKGFGFTIMDSKDGVSGQKVKAIQNNETCTNLRTNDILISLNGQDITKLSHKEVVEKLKNCSPGKDVILTVKRKKRFRSKTPSAMPSENHGGFPLINTPQRNCKTPNVDSLMLRRTSIRSDSVGRSLFAPEQSQIGPINGNTIHSRLPPLPDSMDCPSVQETNYSSMPLFSQTQSIYGVRNEANQEQLYYNNPVQHMSLPNNYTIDSSVIRYHHGPPSISNSEGMMHDNGTNSVNPSETSLPPIKFANANGLSNMNQYNNFMNNDKLMMMQMQQYQHIIPQQPQPVSDYHHLPPLYSNSEMMKRELVPEPIYSSNYQCNYYANNEEIELQRLQYGQQNDHLYQVHPPLAYHDPMLNQADSPYNFELGVPSNEIDECEYHRVHLTRDNVDSNWGIRLIGGSEVGRAISVGSIVSGGAASKNGLLKPGDEIITINGNNVVGATHQHVVELISACSNRASLVVRRKKFAEACEVTLTKNPNEGFGFIIISNENYAKIGRIIPGSPADRCKQLHVRDRIIAVNGRYITPDMQHPEIVNMIKDCGSTLRLRIIPDDCYSVELIKSAPSDNFGFSMRGGSEYDGTPLYIVRVAPNGLARDLLNIGDQIIEINGISTLGMTHHQAANIIKYSHPIVKLKLRRNYVKPPSLLVDSPRDLQKFNQVTAEMQTVNQSASPTSFGNDCSQLLTVPIEN